MNLQQLNYTFSTAFDLAVGLVIPCSMGYVGGYLYGTIMNADRVIAARAFTISIFMLYVFRALTATMVERKNLKYFYATELLGTATLGMLQIASYRQLNLIGSLGTAVMSTFLSGGSLWYLYKLQKFYRSE